jgi:hypothetical protein
VLITCRDEPHQVELLGRLQAGYRRLKVYIIGLLSLVMAAAPSTVSRLAVQLVIEQRSLMEAD